METVLFNTKAYDKRSFNEANKTFGHSITYLESRLDSNTASLANGHTVVCAFVNDVLDAEVIRNLKSCGVRLIALRCAGFNNVDLQAAHDCALPVVRVPEYSPHAVAEHTIALLMNLNRKVHRAYNRIREGNFALEGLQGFDIYGLTAGVIGTGKIGKNIIRLLNGFGCKVLAFDIAPNKECEAMGAKYVEKDELFRKSDIITLHCPLTPQTHHLIDNKALEQMKDGVVILNTSRGALIDTRAVIDALKQGKIGHLGIDVYEEEEELFFEDLSSHVIKDDIFARLMTFPNVIITGHQAFFTREALKNIATTTLENIQEFEQTGNCKNTVSL